MLLETLGPEIAINGRIVRQFFIRPEEKLALGLHGFGHSSEFYSMGEIYGVSKATVLHYMDVVANLIITHFNHFIQLPNAAEAQVIAQEIYLSRGFTGICLAIDGKHIKILNDRDDKYSFRDKNSNFSLTFLAACDHMYRFRWFSSVRCSDARMYNESSLIDKFRDGRIIKCLFNHFNNYKIQVSFNNILNRCRLISYDIY